MQPSTVDLGRPTCLADIEAAAASILPPDVRDFVAGGSDDERGLTANLAALRAVQVVPRVLRDVSVRDTATTLLGRPMAQPVAVAPVAYQQLLHPGGELATARAAAAAGVPFVVPMLSSVPVEALAGAGADLWVQLYWLRDREITADLIARAGAAGARALVLTVDVPLMGRRLRDVRNSFVLPPHVSAVHLPVAGRAGGNGVAAHTAAAFDPSLNWDDLAWIRSRTDLPLILKGVLDPADARRAADEGVAGIVVSNHGGRQLSAAVPGAGMLPQVRAAVGDGCAVLLDGGIRSGTDVLVALALGADAVLVGRPPMWGLAAGGQDGVGAVLRLLAAELDNALALAGCTGPGEARGLTTRAATGPSW
jgi:4-hydroxymandelate oxidase